MLARSIVIALALAAPHAAFADPPGLTPPLDTPPRTAANQLADNALYAELGGSGLVYSFDYERIVRGDLAVRAGFGFTSLGAICGYGHACSFIAGAPNAETSPSANLWLVPITVSYLGIRAHRHALELGGGATLAYAEHVGPADMASSGGAFVSAIVGYRYQPIDRAGFQFRCGFALLAGNGMAISVSPEHPSGIGLTPTGYMSLGVAFR